MFYWIFCRQEMLWSWIKDRFKSNNSQNQKSYKWEKTGQIHHTIYSNISLNNGLTLLWGYVIVSATKCLRSLSDFETDPALKNCKSWTALEYSFHLYLYLTNKNTFSRNIDVGVSKKKRYPGEMCDSDQVATNHFWKKMFRKFGQYRSCHEILLSIS